MEQDQPRAGRFFEQAQSLGFEPAASELAKMGLEAEDPSSAANVVSDAFSGGAEIASQSFRYVTGAFILEEEEGEDVVELTDVNIMCSGELDKRETSPLPEYHV